MSQTVQLQALTYEQSIPAIKAFAGRVMRRARAAGAHTVQFEDIMGELSLAYVVAAQHYNGASGVPFLAYLRRGMMNHINRWIEEEINIGSAMRLDGHQDLGDNLDEDLHKVIPSKDPQPDLLLEMKDFRGFILAKLSAETRRVVELYENPPAFLLEELRALKARSEFGRSRGLTSAAPRDITFPMIFDLLGYGRTERAKIYAELQTIAAKVNK